MSNEPLEGRVAIVTGSSRGMGRAIAVRLAQAGADVLINYRERATEAEAAAAEVTAAGRRSIAVHADVSRPADVDRLVDRCVAELGSPAILVNNAGVGQRVIDVDELDLELWAETIAVNLTSAFLMTKSVLPTMRAAGWGRIINIASTAAQTGGSVGPHYAASKAGLIGLTHGYATKLTTEGITVGTVDEVADVAVMLATNGYMTGQTVSLNGGMYYT